MEALASAPAGPVERMAMNGIRFEPNQGQTDAAVRFVSRGQGYMLFLTADEAVLAVGRSQPAPARSAGELRRRRDTNCPARSTT
jgi:hypothetical protein